ncbi:MAG: ABC transporter substrate-binding protein [Gracilibacteraceae bacterium]|jgi:ABC-type nitrate/sulfonate/bicarbonate transport system substrate-binding protein|nr:ABC transporter substrate-binding protein [Gracilibacteraceae bacterium]
MKKTQRIPAPWKTLLAVALILAVTATVTACGGSPANNQPAAPAAAPAGEDPGGPYVFKLPNISSNATNLDPLSIGVYKGFFAEENVEIVEVGDIPVPELLPALISGTVTITALMTPDGLAAIDNGANVIGIFAWATTTKEQPHMNFLTLKDSPIQSARDLVGQTIGTGGTNGCTLGIPLEYLRQGGVDADDVEVITISPELSMPDALRQGSIAVAGTHFTPDIVATQFPDLRVLFSDYDVLGDTGTDLTYFADKTWLEDPHNQEAVRRFIAAFTKTAKWINANREEAREIYLTEINPNANAELLSIRHFSEDGIIYEDHTLPWIEILNGGKNIQPLQRQDWTFAEVATNAYNPNFTGKQ